MHVIETTIFQFNCFKILKPLFENQSYDGNQKLRYKDEPVWLTNLITMFPNSNLCRDKRQAGSWFRAHGAYVAGKLKFRFPTWKFLNFHAGSKIQSRLVVRDCTLKLEWRNLKPSAMSVKCKVFFWTRKIKSGNNMSTAYVTI